MWTFSCFSQLVCGCDIKAQNHTWNVYYCSCLNVSLWHRRLGWWLSVVKSNLLYTCLSPLQWMFVGVTLKIVRGVCWCWCNHKLNFLFMIICTYEDTWYLAVLHLVACLKTPEPFWLDCLPEELACNCFLPSFVDPPPHFSTHCALLWSFDVYSILLDQAELI